MNDGGKPNWDDLRIFAAIAATGSLTAAATQLRLSQPTIGRRLQALEECLGAALLERTPRGMQLTAKGQALLPLVQQMEQAGDAIDRAAPGLADLPLGTVRIAAGPWNSRFMARRLPEIQAALPEIEIELFNEMTFANLARREADIAIRNRRPNEGRVAVRRLPEPAYAVFGAKSYVDRNPAARTEERYRQCAWIGFDDTYPTSASLVWLRDKLGRSPHVRCSHSTTIYDALVGGAGLAVIPCFAGAEEASLVRLTPPLSDLESQGLWMAVHEDLRHQPRVRLVADNLAALFERHRAELRPDGAAQA
jgi:DNA-binding transcriptional LysR family regulator